MSTVVSADRAPATRLYVLVGLTWLATRAIAVGAIALLPRLLDDIDTYRTWLPALRAAAFPDADPKWQYPPGAGAVVLGPDLLPFDYAVAFVGLCLVFDLAIMAALVTAHSRRTHPATMGLWLWAAAGAVIGPIMVTRFDIVPSFFAVAAILLVARPAWSGASAAIGFLLKLWPALMILALPRRRTRSGVIWFAVTTLVLVLVVTVTFDGALSFLGNQRARGLQVESTGAVPYWLFTLVGGRVASGMDYGSMQVQMAGAEAVGTIVTVIGLALLVLVAWWRLNGRLDGVSAGDVGVTLVLVMVASSRVYSPQFNVWLIAVAAAATINALSRMRTVAAILVGVAVLTQFVYPLFPTNFVDGEAWIVLIQAVRITGLVGATVLAVRAIAFPQRSAHRATAEAAATLSESTPPDIGTRTTTSAD